MPLLPPTVGQTLPSQAPTGTAKAASAQVSPLAQQHKVTSASDGIARFFADLFTKIQAALFTPSPPPPFASLVQAKNTFVQLAHDATRERFDSSEQRAENRIRSAGQAAPQQVASLPTTDKGAVYTYSDDGWMSYSDMNGLVLSALKDGQHFKDSWDQTLDMSLRVMMEQAGSPRNEFLDRVPAQDRDAFMDFARSYYGSMVAHKLVMTREAVEKLPAKPCICDRGLREFPGSVDAFKKMLTTEGRPRFLQEPGFSSSTVNVQSPEDVRKNSSNKAGPFSNDISLLTISRSGKDISLLSASPRESEVLFSAESRFEVFGHKEIAAGEKTKNVFFQLQLSGADHALFTAMNALDARLDGDPTYQLTADDRAAIADARQFNLEVQAQLQEFPALGWKDDLAPGMPATCRLFQQVIDRAAQR